MDHLYYICPVCYVVFQVIGDRGELMRIPEILARLARTCVTDGCEGRVQASTSDKMARTSQQKTTRLTVQEFVAAMAGLGLPDEIDASPEVVSAMLKSCPVIGFTLHRSSHPKRSILTELVLSNNTILHLAAGADGPTVYKITRRKDGRSDLELQTNTEDNSLRLSSSEVAGVSDSSENGSLAARDVTREAVPAPEGIPYLPGGVQETKS